MRYPTHFLERVKNHFLLSEVIARRIAIRRHGREFQALCPFHNEKTPSFTISDEKGFYHCFGCGAHGDVIGFVTDYDKISYREAIEKLAAEAGIPLPEMSREERAKEEKAMTLHSVMEAAADYFTQGLGRSREARDYFAGRKLTPAIIENFRLGFAPAQRTGLKQALLGRGFSEALMREAGLLVQNDSGETFDRFRGRVIFPIQDLRGRIIAFGGRLIGDAPGPKYLNSPETPLFHKGETLYNAHRARRPASDAGRILVAEGYMDVIALHQAGFEYAVAPLGTAVTEQHLKLLWRLHDEPSFVLDSDRAGFAAMLRVAEMALPLLEPGKNLTFVRLPQGEDPDSLLQRRGANALREALSAAAPLSQILWECYAAGNLATPEKRAEVEHRLNALSDAIQNPTIRAHYRAYFREQLWQRPQAKGGIRHLSTPLSAARAAHISDARAIERAEKQMLRFLCLAPALLQHGEVEEAFARMELESPEMQALREMLLDAVHNLDALDEATLSAYFDAAGSGDLYRHMRNDASTPLPRDYLQALETGDETLQYQRWRQIFGGYTITHLEAECRAAEQALAGTTTEEAFERLSELQQALKLARAEWNQSFLETGTD